MWINSYMLERSSEFIKLSPLAHFHTIFFLFLISDYSSDWNLVVAIAFSPNNVLCQYFQRQFFV